MRNNPAKVKWPGYVLGVIAVAAIIAKIVTPSEPPAPGPIGEFGYWKSSVAMGKMAASAVNGSGTMWAGAWNDTTEGKTKSAIWIVDFAKEEARKYLPKGAGAIAHLLWMNDKYLACCAENGAPDLVDATKAEGRIFGTRMTEDKPSYPKDKLPGIVEGSWTSHAGTLILCRRMDDFAEMVYEAKSDKLNQVGKDGYKTDIKANWPDAPKEMLFVTYRGGFKFDLVANKKTQIFDYTGLGIVDERWRTQVQDGRLYPRKDGSYVSVSKSADTIDIRILDKDGKFAKNLLPRS